MSKCACIRETYDFDLIQTSCSNITYIDRSSYQEGADYTDTPGYTVTVKSPSGGTTDYQVTKGIPLHLNLGTCVTPGVYTFTVHSCIDTYSKRVAILCSLWCGYLKAVAKLANRAVGIDRSAIKSIRERLEYIPLIANTDHETATNLTETVVRDLKKINCECACS